LIQRQRILAGAAIPSNGTIVDPYEFLPNWVKLPKPVAA